MTFKAMPVKPIYHDFLNFLDHLGGKDAWSSFQDLYLKPHWSFLKAYWDKFPHFDSSQIAARVKQIKEGDYSQLRGLLQSQFPEALAEEALKRCQEILPLNPEPLVYLFVGFFSADGLALEVEGWPSIALGLERFKHFRDLPLLVAHEYCHCAQQSRFKFNFTGEDHPLLFSIIREGLAILFTEVVFPDVPLHRHLFLTSERLQWCQENQEVLVHLAGADLVSPKLVPILFGPGDPNAGIPPRVGYFVARQMFGHCLTHHGIEDFARELPGFKELFRQIKLSKEKQL